MVICFYCPFYVNKDSFKGKNLAFISLSFFLWVFLPCILSGTERCSEYLCLINIWLLKSLCKNLSKWCSFFFLSLLLFSICFYKNRSSALLEGCCVLVETSNGKINRIKSRLLLFSFYYAKIYKLKWDIIVSQNAFSHF